MKKTSKLFTYFWLFILLVVLSGQTTVAQSDNSQDEFEEFQDFENSEDEFEEFDEFEDFSETADTAKLCPQAKQCSKKCSSNEDALQKSFYWTLGILAFTMIAGVFVRFKHTRNFRGIFLLAGVTVLGFSSLHHACPCMLSSIQDFFLMLFGGDIDWRKTIWFLGLIPITYVFGQVWCGWVCHLGALQEFLYLPGKVKLLQSEKALKTMRIIRWVLFFTLLIQLFIEEKIFFCKIDPFKTVFDLGFLGSKHLVLRWTLLILLLLTSIFSYRPFCKAACPVGLILGLVSKIPGSSVIGIGGKCTSCNMCSKACNMNAITRFGKISKIDNTECIACGDCIDNCKQNGLGFFRKSKKHKTIVECKNECSL